MAKWRERFSNKALRRELLITLVVKLVLLVALQQVLPAKLTQQQAAQGVAERLVGTSRPDASSVSPSQEPR